MKKTATSETNVQIAGTARGAVSLKKNISVGMIGCGRISDMHATVYRRHPHAKLTWVADVNENVARKRAEEWGAKRWTTDFHDILNDSDVDAVEILTPHHTHKDLAVAAAKAGKHVSLQKPMALNLKECQEIVSATQEAGVTLSILENYIYYPPFQKLKALMEDGAIGEPLSVRAHLGGCAGGWHTPVGMWFWRLQPKKGGGGVALFDHGYHNFSMLYSLFGPVHSIRARVRKAFGVWDLPFAVFFNFKNDRVGVFDAAPTMGMTMKSDQFAADEMLEVTGTEGRLLMTRCTTPRGGIPTLRLYRKGVSQVFHHLPDTFQDSFLVASNTFLENLRTGNSPLLTGESGLYVQALSEAAKRSSDEDGKEIIVDDFIMEETR